VVIEEDNSNLSIVNGVYYGDQDKDVACRHQEIDEGCIMSDKGNISSKLGFDNSSQCRHADRYNRSIH
jgi:hypothetical protein